MSTPPRSKVAATVGYLKAAREVGVTWRELAAAEVWGHGSCSRVLSDLHRTGDVVRLTEKRDGCSVYVLAGYAGDRDTIPHGRVSLDAQALHQALAERAAQADAVQAVIDRYGLEASRFPTMWRLASELRTAIGRNTADDEILQEPLPGA